MKKGLIVFLAVLTVFATVLTSCDDGGDGGSKVPVVKFTGVTANGSADLTTTALTLNFDKDIKGLTAAQITLTAGSTGATKGALTGSGKSYTLAISGVTAAGEVTVAVATPDAKAYAISGSPQKVAIFYKAGSVQTATLNSVTANGNDDLSTTALTLTFNQAITGLAATDITLTGVSGITKGNLTAGATAGVYTLEVDVSVGGTLTVAVAKTGWDITDGSKTVTIFYKEGSIVKTEVQFTNLTANGNGTSQRTTDLTLTFSEAIPDLTEANITITSEDVLGTITKGELTAGATAGTYILPISGFTTEGTLTVKPSKQNYTFDPEDREVAVKLSNFDKTVAYKDIKVTGTKGLFTIDEANGIVARPEIAAGQYGDYLGVKIPENLLPVLPSDKITITYFVTGGSAELTTKVDDTDNNNDLPAGADYGSWQGQGQKILEMVKYQGRLPTDYLWFQGRPPTAPWQLKVISVEKEAGPAVKINIAVPGLKPVAGGTPVTEIDTLQYTGVVRWEDWTDWTQPGTGETTFPSVIVDNEYGNFRVGGIYGADIDLEAKPGYTFTGSIFTEGYDVVKVIGAISVSRPPNQGGTNFTLTADFDPAKSAAPALNVTFGANALTEKTVGGNNAVVTMIGETAPYTGLSAVASAGYGWSWVYFKVKFADGLKLSDYSKIDFTVKYNIGEEYTGEDTGGYKDGFMCAYKPAALEEGEEYGPGKGGLPANGDIKGFTTNIVFTETAGNATSGIANPDTEYTRTVTVKVPAGVDENEIWILYGLSAPNPSIMELKDVKFYNPE